MPLRENNDAWESYLQSSGLNENKRFYLSMPGSVTIINNYPSLISYVYIDVSLFSVEYIALQTKKEKDKEQKFQ